MVDDELAESLSWVCSICDFGSLGDQACQNVWIGLACPKYCGTLNQR